MSDTLKTCPFCGGKAAFRSGAASGEIWIVCAKCWSEGPTCDTEVEAIVAWNKRKEEE